MVFAEVQWSQGVEDAWRDTASFVPKLLGFLVILIVGYFIAKAIAKAADVLLERIGFDRAVERGGVGRAVAGSKYEPSDVISKIVFYALFLIVLVLAFGVFGPNPVSDLLEGVIAYLPKVIAAIIIIVVAAAIAAAARDLIGATLGGLSYGAALANAAAIAIMVVGVFAALDQLQIAPHIVTGLFYALLAILVGVAVVAVGGGGIHPMRARWEGMLQRYDAEKPQIQREARGAKERIAEQAEARKSQVRELTAEDGTTQAVTSTSTAADPAPPLPPPSV